MDEPWQAIAEAVGRDLSEFRDLPGLALAVLRLAIAAALGGALGLERTIQGRPAGMRTYMLVALGASAYVLVCEQVGIVGGDLSRVVQGLLTGVGFLGAGIIFRANDRLQARGLTTAAGIWLTAAVGMAVGLGRPATGLLIAALALVILAPMRRVEGWVEARGDRRPTDGAPPAA